MVKICGLATPDAVEAALQGGATHLGFVFHPKSPRDIDPLMAAELAGMARGRAASVAVTADPDDALLERLARDLAPDFVQLHGRETPERLGEVRARTGAGVIKALSVARAADLDGASDYEDLADHLMFDAKPESGDLPGGTGAAFDWSILAGRRFAKPWFLAGGLTPANVAEAIAATGAPGVDVSSGVESTPGVKEPASIAAFLRAARSADRF
ncbi:MAG: phosphoribosylanthranilate isomerase [Pseudomonadota bacterium]|nr:phosphoribosylanthranilate isomerase [Pseudomonadota bacterium]